MNWAENWAVRERAPDVFVGEVALMDARRDLIPPLGAPELGWVQSPTQQGKGYAAEAVRAALAWAEGHFGHSRAVCIIGPDSAAPLRVAHRCGFREAERVTCHGEIVIQLERP